jgi:hypothetical protein
MAAENEIFRDADDERGEEERKEPAVMLIEIRPKVDAALIDFFRKNHRGHDVQRRRLREDDREADERPIAIIA